MRFATKVPELVPKIVRMANDNHKRPGATNCDDPFPKSRDRDKVPPDKAGKPNTRRPEERPLSFDEVASLNMHEQMLRSNAAAIGPMGHSWPSLAGFLKSLERAVSEYPSSNGLTFSENRKRKGLELVFAFVEDVRVEHAEFVSAKDLSRESIFGPWRGDVHILRLLAATGDVGQIWLPEMRFAIARSKFSVPSGAWVRGPFLAVMSKEIGTPLVVRARMWPAWLDLVKDRFALKGSSLEGFQIDAASEAGGVALSFSKDDQLAELQRLRGHLWRGDIGRYSFRPDSFFLPQLGCLPLLTEIFGLTRFRHYSQGMGSKLPVALAGHNAGHYNLQYIIPTKRTGAALEEEIRNWVFSLYEDPANNLFRL